MAILTAIRTAFAVGREVYRFIREYERQGVARLSPAAAMRDRRRLERLGLWLHEGRDQGVRRFIKVDDAGAEYLWHLLKSANLETVLTSTTTKGREEAKRAILDGAEMIDEARCGAGPAADRAKP